MARVLLFVLIALAINCGSFESQSSSVSTCVFDESRFDEPPCAYAP